MYVYAVFFHRNSFIIAANPFCSPLAQNEVVGNFVVHLPFSISHFAKSEVSEAQQQRQQHPKCWPLPNRQADIAVAVIILVRSSRNSSSSDVQWPRQLKFCAVWRQPLLSRADGTRTTLSPRPWQSLFCLNKSSVTTTAAAMALRPNGRMKCN